MRLSVWVATLFVSTALAFVNPAALSIAAPPRSLSSAASLLSPHIHLGETFTWQGRLRHRSVENTRHGPIELFDSHTDLISCTVLRGSRNSFVASRRIKVFLPPFRPHVLAGDPFGPTRPAQVGLVPWPSIIIRKGYEFSLDGPPLRYDPICKFYSTTLFGVPPSKLRVGTSWRFGQTTYWGKTSKIDGAVSVTELDPVKGTVTLRIKMIAPHDLGINPYLAQVAIVDGGVIATENDRGEFVTVSAIQKEIGTPSEVDAWRLQRP